MKRFCLRFAKVLIAAIMGLALSPNARAAENLRYLFLIDHSPDMATRQIATVQIIYDAIRTGFQNEIQPGEKFALWFYGSRLQTNAPFTWQPGHEIEIARAAANLFTGRIYSRMRPREQTLADAAPFIAASPKITVFIITDGSQPLSGTPFDTAINATIDAQHFAFLRADKPFVITLLARNGKWVDGNIFADVNAPFRIPEMDRRNELMDQALEAVRTAQSPTTQNAGENALDKAREALRDALSGKTPPTAPAQPATVAKMDLSPTLKEPPKEQEKSKLDVQPKEEPQKKASVQPDAPQTLPKEEPKAKEEKATAPVVVAQAQQQAPVESPKPPTPKTEAPAVAAIPVPKSTVEKPAETPPNPTPTPTPPQPEKHPEVKPAAREEPKPISAKTQSDSKAREEAKIAQPKEKPPVRDEGVKVTPQATPPAVTKPTTSAAPVPSQSKPASPAILEKKNSNAPPIPLQTAAVTPAAKRFPWRVVGTGLALIFIGAGIAWLRARQRAKSPGSIITQALPRSTAPWRRK